MSDEDKKVMWALKMTWASLFVLLACIFLPFAILFGLRAFSDDPLPECYAPLNELATSSDVDQTWRLKFTIQWGFWTNAILAANLLCVAFSPLPFALGSPSFMTATGCGTTLFSLLSVLAAPIVYLIPIFIWTYPGRYCSG